MYLLNKPNHCLSTIRIERVIIWGPHAYERALSICNRICTYWRLDIVPKIRSKSGSIIQFYSHGLIINSTPSALDWLAVFLCYCYEIIMKFDIPDILLSKVELMIFWQDLDVIRSFMSAYFISVEYIYGVDLLWYMEIPRTKNLILQAMNRLICFGSCWIHIEY